MCVDLQIVSAELHVLSLPSLYLFIGVRRALVLYRSCNFSFPRDLSAVGDPK